jgi:hypothetical protein
MAVWSRSEDKEVDFVDPARITGILTASGDENFPVALTALTHLTVSPSDEDKEYEIPLDP